MADLPKTALEYFNAGAATYEAGTGGCTHEIARYILQLSKIDSTSVVLDNACGTGIVAEEILLDFKDRAGGTPEVYCADGAQAMVENARVKLLGNPNAKSLHFDVAGGELLPYASETFTHSITSFGIMFFTDALKGAGEIYRTLKPNGTAIITTWRDVGYVDLIQKAQKAVRPDATLFQVPIPPPWFTTDHLDATLRHGGFKDVKIHEKEVYYCAESAEGLVDNLLKLFGHVIAGWDDNEKQKFSEEFAKVANQAVKQVQRRGPKGIESLVGIQMVAFVAVAMK